MGAYANFYNSVNNDRLYDASSMEEWLRPFFVTGVFNGNLQVTADGQSMTVTVAPGYVNIKGKTRWFETSNVLSISASSGSLSRIDAIVVRRDDAERNITLEVVEGTAASNPIAPAPTRTDSVYELVLAYVSIGVGAINISQANTIKQYGIIQPLIVQKKGRRFEIIAGERRWRAARLAGLKEVPVLVKEYAPEEIFAVALIENIQRQDLNPIEEATAYQRLIQEYNLKQDEVAEKVAKNRVTITNSMRLLKLDTRVQQMLIDEKISGGHARALLPITDAEMQVVTAMKVFDERLSVRETEKLVKKIVEGTSKEKNPEKQQEQLQHQAIYRELEERMKAIFGTKVEIKNKSNNKGKIEIEYYSAEELERLIDMIQKIDPSNG